MNAVASSNALLCYHRLSRLTFFCFFFVFAGSSAAPSLGRGRPCIGPNKKNLLQIPGQQWPCQERGTTNTENSKVK